MTHSHPTLYDPARIRTDPTPARHDEPTATFYDRCSNPVIGLVRDNLNRWYGEYRAPKRYRHDLRGKLLDTDRRQWNSGAWELYVHAALLRMGLGPQPGRVPGSNRSIDFLTTVGEPVFIECAVLGHADPEHARRAGVGSMYAAVDRINVYGYWLDVQVDRVGQGELAVRELVESLRAWLVAQDIEVLGSLARRGLSGLPSFDWVERDWLVRIWAIPRSPELRGREDLRPIGIMSADDGEDGPLWQDLLGRMEAKADIYGELGAPYVIAVNAPDAWPDHREAEWAVLGPHPFTEAWQRSGFFLRDDGTTHSNVSGVLVATALQPHSFTRQNATLYENPAAARSVPRSLRWRRVRVVDGRREEEPGVEPADLFGLPAEWPGIPWP